MPAQQVARTVASLYVRSLDHWIVRWPQGVEYANQRNGYTSITRASRHPEQVASVPGSSSHLLRHSLSGLGPLIDPVVM